MEVFFKFDRMLWMARRLVCAWLILALGMRCQSSPLPTPFACKPCPIGSGVVEVCTNTQQTKCRPCVAGKSYSSSEKNYHLPCQPVSSTKEVLCDVTLNQIQIPADETHDIMCVCADGYKRDRTSGQCRASSAWSPGGVPSLPTPANVAADAFLTEENTDNTTATTVLGDAMIVVVMSVTATLAIVAAAAVTVWMFKRCRRGEERSKSCKIRGRKPSIIAQETGTEEPPSEENVRIKY
eukprot:m.60663 g.60663  ORF g.60663 m.60663 type:complete len:238 (+) comp34941_c0_seq6:158-871(+)